MTVIRRAALASAIIALASTISAQELAVSGKTPANPLLILSVPDSATLWKTLGESKFGQLVERRVEFPNVTATERAALEKNLGFTLDPSEFFVKTIEGFDVYFLDVDDEPSFVVAAKFRDSSAPGRILDQLKKDAATATGNAGGVLATTVIDSTTTTGARQLSLPAFQMFLAADGSTLVWANQKSTLESAFKDEGKAIFNSDYFRRYMDELKDEPGKTWMFGEISKALPFLTSLVPGANQETVGAFAATTLGARFDASKDSIKLSTFQHQEDMPSAQRRYVMAAPPAGDVDVLNYFPESTNVLFATNHFDALSILESATEAMKDSPEAPVTAADVDKQLQSAKALLGFDVKDDLLANLGPEFGVGLTTSDSAKEGEIPFDVFLITHVKDADRFKTILQSLEDSANAMNAPTPAPTRRAPKNEDPNAPKLTPTPAPTPALQTEDFEGETIKYVASKSGPTAEMEPGYTFTKDNYFIFSLNRATIKTVLQASKGSKGIADTKVLKDSNEHLAKNRNAIFLVDTAAIHALLDKNKEKFTTALSADRKTEFELLMTYLDSVRSVSSVASYTNQGKKQELVLLF